MLEAVEHDVLVSVRRNRLYQQENTNKGEYKLVLAITLKAPQAEIFIQEIDSAFHDTVSVLLERVGQGSQDIINILLYCRDAGVVFHVIDQFLIDYNLRSNTRYEQVTPKELQIKALEMEAENGG